MKITKTKTIIFKVEDIASTNKIMGQRGTLFVEATIIATDCDKDYGIDYEGTYTMQWSSSFSENVPYCISSALKNEMLELFLNSEFNEGEAFALSERTLHDLSYFQKYGIPYMVSHDCARVESLISLATKFIVETEIADEPLNTDAVDKLVLDIKSSFHKHEGNNFDELSESKILTYVNILENGDTLEFEYNELFYEIFESSESGYIVNVYSSNQKDAEGGYMDTYEVDGGLCTGSARDAVEFML